MKYSILTFSSFFYLMTSCNTIPSLYQSIEDMEDNNAISINVSKEAFARDKDMYISIDINADNKETENASR